MVSSFTCYDIISNRYARRNKNMARPKTKNELLEATALNYDKLLKLIDSMTEIELSTEFDF